MKNDLFKNQLKFFIKCSKKVDIINEKFQEEFKIIFECHCTKKTKKKLGQVKVSKIDF